LRTARSFAISPEAMAGDRQEPDALASRVLALSRTLQTQKQCHHKRGNGGADTRGLGSGRSQSGHVAPRSQDLCAEMLREQIAMVAAALVPGGTLDRQIEQAELRVQQLKTERDYALHTVATLRDALRQVAGDGETRLE
jgi:hypothetical protein